MYLHTLWFWPRLLALCAGFAAGYSYCMARNPPRFFCAQHSWLQKKLYTLRIDTGHYNTTWHLQYHHSDADRYQTTTRKAVAPPQRARDHVLWLLRIAAALNTAALAAGRALLLVACCVSLAASGYAATGVRRVFVPQFCPRCGQSLRHSYRPHVGAFGVLNRLHGFFYCSYLHFLRLLSGCTIHFFSCNLYFFVRKYPYG